MVKYTRDTQTVIERGVIEMIDGVEKTCRREKMRIDLT